MENINKLKGIELKEQGKIKVYNEKKKLLSIEEAKNQVIKVWKGVYNQGNSDIKKVWNEERKEKLIAEQNKEREDTMNKRKLREHMDMEREMDEVIVPMDLPVFTKETLEEELKQLKKNKAVGTNKLRAELYKSLGESEICKEKMVNCFNNALETGKIPKSWNISRTRLIKKVTKPGPKEFRPITIVNISYKIFFSFLNKQIEKHLRINNLVKENQVGFTKGGRIEFNHFILQYIIEKANKRGEKLIVIALDFKKAFDSIDRSKLIEVLVRYKIHPNMIDLIVKVYSNDSTTLTLGDLEEKMFITSGIKQGCTASTTFFKLVTYMIMKTLEVRGSQFQIDNLTINSIFYADDSMAIARSVEEARKNLEIVTEVSKTYGLHINVEKSSALIYNNSDGVKEIEGIKVVDKVKYLGLTLSEGKDIFKEQKEDMINKAKKLSNLTYSVIARSCNKVLIGKTFWKSIVLPSVLYGAGLMNTTVSEVNSLQVVENGVFRKILGARKSTANAALRGEIGASLMSTRFVKSRLMLVKSIQDGNNELVKEILKNFRKDSRSEWNSTLNVYLNWTKITYDELINMTKIEVKKKVNEYDNELWREEMQSKSTLRIYRMYRSEVKQEKVYDNRNASVLLFLARTDSLKLNYERRHSGGDTKCSLCKVENENAVHFIMKCQNLREKRNDRILSECEGATEEEKLGDLLFGERNIEDVKSMLQGLWQLRFKLLKSRCNM